jgi:predicted TIM-barrel fold metal-dependent hydrolase
VEKERKMLKIDVFNHVLPERFLKAIPGHSRYVPSTPGSEGDRLALHDLDTRFRIMDRFDGYVQIICMAEPPVEDVGDGSAASELARIANDSMAEMVARYPDRFIAAVACLPMNDMGAALTELDRTVRDLKFKGVQISSTIMDKSLDSLEFDPFFARMSEYNLPILIHPRHRNSGPRAYSPYANAGQVLRPAETLAGWPFNWAYESTLAMGSLVMGGVLNKYRNLKIVTHHLGGLVPYQAIRIKRVELALSAEERERVGRERSVHEWYQMLYGDTALWGNTPALECGLKFFGPDHVLFGTDMPFGLRGGEAFIRNAIQSVEEADMTTETRAKIYELNARKLFCIPI